MLFNAQCENTFYGMDCGHVSTLSPPTTLLPGWLLTGNGGATPQAAVGGKGANGGREGGEGGRTGTSLRVKRVRPLIHVYDMPPELSTGVYQVSDEGKIGRGILGFYWIVVCIECIECMKCSRTS